jgi:hypothetical protein
VAVSTVCSCNRLGGLARYVCSHWTTGPLTQTELEYGVQRMGASMGIRPDPKRELWSDWKWIYPAAMLG